jgi:hypothetical protein
MVTPAAVSAAAAAAATAVCHPLHACCWCSGLLASPTVHLYTCQPESASCTGHQHLHLHATLLIEVARDFFPERPLAPGWPRGLGSWLVLATNFGHQALPVPFVWPRRGAWPTPLQRGSGGTRNGYRLPPPPNATVLSLTPQWLVVLRNTGLR